MSAGCFDNASCLQTLYKMNEDHFLKSQQIEKQGIVSILSSDFNSNKILSPLHNSSNSIRRTLSADMSSQKWLQNNGFPQSPVKKRVKSSVQLQALGEEDNHDSIGDPDNSSKGPAFEDVWSSIQADKKSWGCILSPPNNNSDGSGSDPGQVRPPYVHPLAKRTASSLSEKSLEICTESLGSETGSEGFSYPPSEPEDSEHEDVEDEEEEEEESEAKVYNVQVHRAGMGISKSYNNRGPTPTPKRSMMVPATRPLPLPSFPPPLPSLGHQDDGSNLHIRSHRQDGRLVVEAVSVPSQNCFRAQRQDGRLLLTFSRCSSGDDHYSQNQLVQDEDEDEDEDEETEHIEEKKVPVAEEEETRVDVTEDEKGAVMDVQIKRRSCTAVTMMNKFIELSNKSAAWPRNYNKTVIKPLNHNDDEEKEEEEAHAVGVAKTAKQSSPSLPPRPITTKSTATAALNAYEYYWRRSSSTAVGMLKPLANNNINININYKSEVGKLKPTKRNNNKLHYAALNNKDKKGASFSLEDSEELVKADAATTGAGAGAGAGGRRSGAAEYVDVVPLMLRGCKEAKKPSLLLWEPYCIATS